MLCLLFFFFDFSTIRVLKDLSFFLHYVVTPQPEAVATVENQPIEDPPSSRFTWMIENFSRLTAKKQYSDVFVVGGYKWYAFNCQSILHLEWFI